MEKKLVSSWFNSVKTLPDSYIFPPDTRPGKLVDVPVSSSIPVIDLLGDRAAMVRQIIGASHEFGFFQVVNHGVPEELVKESISVLREFFEMADEDKASVYCEDPRRSCRLYTSSINYKTEEVHFWRDNLKHPCLPNLEDCIKIWPQKPTRYREVIGAYSVEAKKLGLRILELISEGLGLEHDYFGGKLSEVVHLSVNHYPPCPDPSLTLGLSKHCDPNTITILHQDIYGLQVLKDGEWIGVDPLPNAFVVNIGYQLQIISNNTLKSAIHRVVTNSRAARTTAAFFINPRDDSVIEPAKQVVDAIFNPPLYRGFQYKEFLLNFVSVMGDIEATLEPFKLQA